MNADILTLLGSHLFILVVGVLLGRRGAPLRVITDAGDTHADAELMLTADHALIDRQCERLQRTAHEPCTRQRIRAGSAPLKPSYDGRTKPATQPRA